MNIEDSPENVSDSEYVPDNRNIKQMLEQNSKNVARQNITTKAPKAKTPKPSSKANAEKAREAKKQKMQNKLLSQGNGNEQELGEEEEVIYFNFGTKDRKKKYIPQTSEPEVKQPVKQTEPEKVEQPQPQPQPQVDKYDAMKADMRAEMDEIKRLIIISNKVKDEPKPTPPPTPQPPKNNTNDILRTMSKKIINI